MSRVVRFVSPRAVSSSQRHMNTVTMNMNMNVLVHVRSSCVVVVLSRQKRPRPTFGGVERCVGVGDRGSKTPLPGGRVVVFGARGVRLKEDKQGREKEARIHGAFHLGIIMRPARGRGDTTRTRMRRDAKEGRRGGGDDGPADAPRNGT